MALQLIKTKYQVKIAPANILERAGQAEADGKLELAARLYEQAVKEKPVDEFPYNRLMIIYRKLKSYKDELRVINAGIKNFQEAHKKKAQGSVRKNSTISRLSTALMKSAGLLDKKGNLVYEPGPIDKWKKRKLVVEKKLKH